MTDRNPVDDLDGSGSADAADSRLVAGVAGDPKAGDPISATQHSAQATVDATRASGEAATAGDPKSGDAVSAIVHTAHAAHSKGGTGQLAAVQHFPSATAGAGEMLAVTADKKADHESMLEAKKPPAGGHKDGLNEALERYPTMSAGAAASLARTAEHPDE